MKIKLQDYSLISNEWIDNEIEILISRRDSHNPESQSYIFIDGKIGMLDYIKQKLISSEKLAEVAYDTAISDSRRGIDTISNLKQYFLNSEIEII